MMLLITSAAYIDGELASEFGNIPPCYLPIGNRRLYEHQIKLARDSGFNDIYISFPDDFELALVDLEYFSQNEINIIGVPVGLSLGESIAYCWSYFEGKYKNLHILHGDTYYLDSKLTSSDDVLFISYNEGYYSRAIVKQENSKLKIITCFASEDELILSGYFSFSNGPKFIKELHFNRFDFIKSIENYNIQYPFDCKISKKWLDFGHVTSYFRSRASMTTQRVFNGLEIDNNTVIKSSKNKVKMLGEYSWFNNVPDRLKVFCPNSFWYKDNNQTAEYAIEYIYASSLSDLLVFARHKAETWKGIFYQIKDFINKSKSYSQLEKVDYSIFDDLYLKKTISRLNQYQEQTGFDIYQKINVNGMEYPSLIAISEQSAEYISAASHKDVSIVHGDLCFSNILYNFRSQSIKLIDPRGIDNVNNITILGDQRYELAKFAHSIIGLYDFILAGMYKVNCVSDNEYYFSVQIPTYVHEIQKLFHNIILDNDDLLFKQIMAINVHLFLSMLPLHHDDHERQTALMLNGVYLYEKYIKM